MLLGILKPNSSKNNEFSSTITKITYKYSFYVKKISALERIRPCLRSKQERCSSLYHMAQQLMRLPSLFPECLDICDRITCSVSSSMGIRIIPYAQQATVAPAIDAISSRLPIAWEGYTMTGR